MRTRPIWTALLLSVLAAAVSGCTIRTSEPVDLTTVLGCTYVRSILDHRDGAVLRVRVADCSPSTPDPEQIAAATWRFLGDPVDLVEITVPNPSTITTMVRFDGADLAQRYELGSLPRTPRTVSAMLSDLLWLLLPAAYFAVAVMWMIAVRRMRRAGIVLIVFRS